MALPTNSNWDIDNFSYLVSLINWDGSEMTPLFNVRNISFTESLGSYTDTASFEVSISDNNIDRLTGDKHFLISLDGELLYHGIIETISKNGEWISVSGPNYAITLADYKINNAFYINTPISDIMKDLCSYNIASSPVTRIYASRNGDLFNIYNHEDRIIDGYKNYKDKYSYWYGGECPQYCIIDLQRVVPINKIKLFFPFWGKERTDLINRKYGYKISTTTKNPFKSYVLNENFNTENGNAASYLNNNFILPCGNFGWEVDNGKLSSTGSPADSTGLPANHEQKSMLIFKDKTTNTYYDTSKINGDKKLIIEARVRKKTNSKNTRISLYYNYKSTSDVSSFVWEDGDRGDFGVYKVQDTTSTWIGTTRAVVNISAPMTKYTSEITLSGVNFSPFAFPHVGYAKIDNELVHYGNRNASSQMGPATGNFSEIERGAYNTEVMTHSGNSVASIWWPNMVKQTTNTDEDGGWITDPDKEGEWHTMKIEINTPEGSFDPDGSSQVYNSSKQDYYVQCYFDGLQVFNIPNGWFSSGQTWTNEGGVGIGFMNTSGSNSEIEIDYFRVFNHGVWETLLDNTTNEIPAGPSGISHEVDYKKARFIKVDMTYDSGHLYSDNTQFNYIRGLSDIAEVEVYTPIFYPNDSSNSIYNYVHPLDSSIDRIYDGSHWTTEVLSGDTDLSTKKKLYNAYFGVEHVSKSRNNKLKFSFAGRRVDIIARTGPRFGLFDVYLDGETSSYKIGETVDLTSNSKYSEKNLCWNSEFNGQLEREDNSDGIEGWTVGNNTDYSVERLDSNLNSSLLIETTSIGYLTSEYGAIPVIAGEVYTLSFYAKSTASICSSYAIIGDINGNELYAYRGQKTDIPQIDEGDKFRRYSFTITAQVDGYLQIRFEPVNGSMYLDRVQIEKNSEATDYEDSFRLNLWQQEVFTYTIPGVDYDTETDEHNLYIIQPSSAEEKQVININTFAGFFSTHMGVKSTDDRDFITSGKWEQNNSSGSRFSYFMKSNTIGDEARFNWYGTLAGVVMAKGPSFGMATISHGSYDTTNNTIVWHTSGTYDLYNTEYVRPGIVNVTNSKYGVDYRTIFSEYTIPSQYKLNKHVTKIVIATKNSSSSGNEVKIDGLAGNFLNVADYEFKNISNSAAISDFCKLTGQEFKVYPNYLFDNAPVIGTEKDYAFIHGKNITSSKIDENYKDIVSQIVVEGADVNDLANVNSFFDYATYMKYGFRQATIKDNSIYDEYSLLRRAIIARKELTESKVVYNADVLDDEYNSIDNHLGARDRDNSIIKNVMVGDIVSYFDQPNSFYGNLRIYQHNVNIDDKGVLKTSYQLSSKIITLGDLIGSIARDTNINANYGTPSPYNQSYISEQMPLIWVTRSDTTYESSSVWLQYSIPENVNITSVKVKVQFTPLIYKNSTNVVTDVKYPKYVKCFYNCDKDLYRYSDKNLTYLKRSGGTEITNTFGIGEKGFDPTPPGTLTDNDSRTITYEAIFQTIGNSAGSHSFVLEMAAYSGDTLVDINSLASVDKTEAIKYQGSGQVIVELRGFSQR